MTAVSAQRLATLFVEVADTLVDEFDVIEFLQTQTRGGAQEARTLYRVRHACNP